MYLGNGDGTFKAAIDSGSVGDFDMTVGDFNGDGKLDVAIAGYNSSTQGVIQIMLGNGDGTFRAGQTINMSDIPRSITTADFNGDGKLDLAVALDKVYLYKGAGDGTFASEGSVVVGNQNLLNQIRVGDFNGDGKPDIAVEDEYSVYVLWGTGAFTFNTTKVATYTFTGNITPVDINQDGLTDLTTTYYTCTQYGSPACPVWQVLLGVSGKETLKTGYTLPASTTYQSFYSQTAADINGDGFNDMVALTPFYFMLVWLGNPDGTFQTTPLQFELGSNSSSDALVASDFNRDGKIDFAVANPGDLTTAVLLNATPPASTCKAGIVSPSVTECKPIDFTYSTSPLKVTAESTDTAHKVTSMQIYINNSLYYTANSNSLNYSTSLSNGDYFIVTKAWDSSGANFQTDRHVNIYTGTPGETCATPAMSITVCSPTQNQTTTTSVHVFANSESNVSITAVQVYIDNQLVYNDTSQSTYVDTTFSVTKGQHNIVVKAFDANGKIYSQSRTINAQ